MNRITEKILQSKVDYLNELTGNPLKPYALSDDGTYKPCAHNYHLDFAYGNVALTQMMTTGTGVRTILGRTTKRELYDQICALIQGFSLKEATK